MTAAEFVKQYCEAAGWTEKEFYESQVPMPDSTSPSGWAAVSNSPLAIKAHVDLYMRMPLAGMDSEPLAYFYPGDETEWQGVALAEELDDEQKARCIPLYAAPPAPVAVPDELTREEYKRRFMEEDNFDDTYRDGWKDYRAAMLKHQSSIASSAGAGGSVGIKQPSSNEPIKSATVPEGLASSVKCWCRSCRPVNMTDMRFVVCPDCGNKRCPRANDHRNACSGSNEPGQPGSAAPSAPEQEV